MNDVSVRTNRMAKKINPKVDFFVAFFQYVIIRTSQSPLSFDSMSKLIGGLGYLERQNTRVEEV